VKIHPIFTRLGENHLADPSNARIFASFLDKYSKPTQQNKPEKRKILMSIKDAHFCMMVLSKRRYCAR